MRARRPLAGFILTGLLALAVAVPEAVAAELTPYRASYGLVLGPQKRDSDVAEATGRISIEESAACDGWTVQQKFELHIVNNEGNEVTIASSFVSVETKDGLRLRFQKRDLKDGKPDKDLSGEAVLKAVGEAGEARFTKPQPSTSELPAGTIFPSAHTRLLLDKAKEGETFVVAHVFDGTAEGGAQEVTAVIGKPEKRDDAAKGEKIDQSLVKAQAWPVHLAFFSVGGGQGQDVPEFEISMRLLENGISREMVLDYGDFAVKATLEQLEALPKPPGC